MTRSEGIEMTDSASIWKLHSTNSKDILNFSFNRVFNFEICKLERQCFQFYLMN